MLLTVREMIGISWKTYKKHWKPITGYLVKWILILLLVALFFGLVFKLSFLAVGTVGSILGIILRVIVIIAIIYFLFQTWVGFKLVLRKALQEQELGSFAKTLKEAKTITPRAIGTSFLAGLIAFLPLFIGASGFLGFFTFTSFVKNSPEAVSTPISPDFPIGGVLGFFFALLAIYGLFHFIYFAILLSMSFYGVIFEGKKVKESLKFSQSLVKGRWWAVWWRIFAPQTLLMVIYLFIAIPVLFIQQSYGQTAADMANALLSVFIQFSVAIPLVYLPALVLYDDLKKKPLEKT